MTPESQLADCPRCTKSDVIDDTAKNVKQIKGALLGDEFHKVGYIDKQHSDHVRIVRLERLVWIGTGVAAVVVFLIKLVF